MVRTDGRAVCDQILVDEFSGLIGEALQHAQHDEVATCVRDDAQNVRLHGLHERVDLSGCVQSVHESLHAERTVLLACHDVDVGGQTLQQGQRLFVIAPGDELLDREVTEIVAL